MAFDLEHMTFQLHPQLQKDCITLGKFELCRLLLMNDSRFPWFILVPEIESISEIFELDKVRQSLLLDESSYLAEKLSALFRADKMNIAAIGNMVPQLHLHHIVRYRNDAVWPAPVWGRPPALPYTGEQLAETINRVNSGLDRLIKP